MKRHLRRQRRRCRKLQKPQRNGQCSRLIRRSHQCDYTRRPIASPDGLKMKYIKSDGARAAAGFDGKARDCVCRAIAIASGRDYRTIWNDLATATAKQSGGIKRKASADHGINTQRKWFKDYMKRLGFRWLPTRKSKIKFCVADIPAHGRLVVMLSRHSAAVLDGSYHDADDYSGKGRRWVAGYYLFEKKPGNR
jgi:hypothetical protein